MKLPRTPIRKARIEIIPMIDTIFFLLVFFMIASLTMIRMRAMAVALPKGAPATANPGTASTGGGDLILTMSDKGEYYLGKERLGPDKNALQEALEARFASGTPKDVVLNFNKYRTTQELISVMDVINRAKGVNGHDIPVLIATAPVDQEGHAFGSSADSSDPGGSIK